LENTDAYTYLQWERIVYNAYNDEWNSIKHVELLWSVLDYKAWLSQFMPDERKRDVYSGYRSHAFHFVFYTEADKTLLDNPDLPWVMKYLKYSFHRKDTDCQYFPRPECHPLLSWLAAEPFGEPDLQNPGGLWYDRSTEEDRENHTVVDRVTALNKIVGLLSLSSNAATEEDIAWWRAFFDMIPCADRPLPHSRQWKFHLPNPEGVNATAQFTSVDLRQLDDVEPTPAPKCEFLISKYLTKAQKRDTLKLLEDMSTLEEHVHIEDNTFVVFKTSPDWAELGQEQEGMDANCTSLPFTLGKTVSAKRKAPTAPGNIWVEVWYPVNGDPNSLWCKWERKQDNGKGSPWVLQIERDTIVLINPSFQDKKGMSKIMTATSKKELALTPGLGYSYLPGKDGGLLPTSEVEKRLKRKENSLKHSTSVQSMRKKKTLRTRTLHHQRTQQILKRKLLDNDTDQVLGAKIART
jgi:hypothetical protein